MFGIGGSEFVVLCLVAVLIIGPERLPKYAEQLARLVRVARGYIGEAKSRVDQELGDQMGVDWSKLDPRQYDPRRIVRDALLDDPIRPATASAETGQSGGAGAPGYGSALGSPSGSAPFDDEAT